LTTVTCERWREAISARADGEALAVEGRMLDAHLRRCPACRRIAAVAPLAVPAASTGAPPEDLPRRIARMTAAADRAAAWSTARALLAVVAVEIIVVSIRPLLGAEQATSPHDARHLGAFAVAYGVGLLVVVARPARARTMLPVAIVVAAALVIGSIVDLAQRRIPIFDEAAHLPEVVSVALVWLLAVPARRAGDGRGLGALLDRHRRGADDRLELTGPHADRQLPASGEAEIGVRLVVPDAEREHFRT
jgi:predicted anti-sigma-YlaC factor YlaD